MPWPGQAGVSKPERMQIMKNSILIFIHLIIALMLLAGCNQTEPEVFQDPGNYTYMVNDRIQDWTVEASGPVEVHIEEENGRTILTVSASKRANSSGSNNSNSSVPAPDIRISGKGADFKVYLCGTLIAGTGTVVEAYSCNTVKAMAESRVKMLIGEKLLAVYGDTRIIETRAVAKVYCYSDTSARGEEASALDCSTGKPIILKEPAKEAKKDPQPPASEPLPEKKSPSEKVPEPENGYEMQ